MKYQAHDEDQADVTELIPRECESPWLNQDEHQQGTQPARDAIDRDVDERLHFLPQLRRQRQEEHLARRLVDGVAERAIHDARKRRRPEDLEGDDERGGDAEVRRQDQQGEADTEIAVDARRDPDLDDECSGGKVKPDLGEERADRIFLSGSPEDLGGHVQLLIDQRGTQRPESDHHGDQLDLLGFTHQGERALDADAALLVDVGAGCCRRLFPAKDDRDDDEAGEKGEGAHQEQRVGANLFDDPPR